LVLLLMQPIAGLVASPKQKEESIWPVFIDNRPRDMQHAMPPMTPNIEHSIAPYI